MARHPPTGPVNDHQSQNTRPLTRSQTDSERKQALFNHTKESTATSPPAVNMRTKFSRGPPVKTRNSTEYTDEGNKGDRETVGVLKGSDLKGVINAANEGMDPVDKLASKPVSNPAKIPSSSSTKPNTEPATSSAADTTTEITTEAVMKDIASSHVASDTSEPSNNARISPSSDAATGMTEEELFADPKHLKGEALLKLAETQTNQDIAAKIPQGVEGSVSGGSGVASRIRTALRQRANATGEDKSDVEASYHELRRRNGIRTRIHTRAPNRSKKDTPARASTPARTPTTSRTPTCAATTKKKRETKAAEESAETETYEQDIGQSAKAAKKTTNATDQEVASEPRDSDVEAESDKEGDVAD